MQYYLIIRILIHSEVIEEEKSWSKNAIFSPIVGKSTEMKIIVETDENVIGQESHAQSAGQGFQYLLL